MTVAKEPRDAVTPLVRPARPDDVPRIWELLLEFARYEKLEHLATGSPAEMARYLFGDAWPRVEGLVAEVEGNLVGYAIFFGSFSTFWAKPMLWLEDLFVTTGHRERGVGRSLMAAVARVAVERGCARMGWAVLEWNAPGIEFYERLGATRDSGWFAYRLEGKSLMALASSELPSRTA